MMTSFAFILGVLPLVISTGAGAEMRRTLGVAVFSGMLGVTLFGIFLTPVFFNVIQWFSDRRQQRRAAGLGRCSGTPCPLPRTPPIAIVGLCWRRELRKRRRTRRLRLTIARRLLRRASASARTACR